MRRAGYPFAAVCGLEKAREAVLLALVNPRAGGLLVSGEKGTGKSTLLRAARELTDAPWVEIPVSVTEDRLFGSIDAEAAIREGVRRLLAGLIDAANGGIVYIDDANLLREDLLSSTLSIEEAGGYRLERDGLSERRDTRYTVLAVMSPESGTLSASALDRFGLFVEAAPIADEEARSELVRRVLAFESDSEAFRAKWREETEKLRAQVAAARALVPDVEVSDAMLRLAAVYTLKAYVSGHRADIYLIEAAKAAAALAGRRYLLPKDLERAAEFVLPHRVRKPPEPAEAQQQQEEAPPPPPPSESKEPPPPEDMFNRPSDTPPPPETDTEARDGGDERKEDAMANPNAESGERVDAADVRVKLPPVWIEPPGARRPVKGSGKRSNTKTDEKRGRYVRAELPRSKTSDIAFDATLRAAAPYQRVRDKHGLALAIRPEDIRSKVREKRTGNIFLFVVDASGSMGARERMKTVKGVILKILLEAYQKRDRVGMIAFRRDRAEVLLPVTRSVDFAQKKLATMPTGGKTPLAKGLSKAGDVLDMLYRQDPQQDPVVLLITDGRATMPMAKDGDAVQDALGEAASIGKRGLPAAVIDTENGFIKLGLAKKLAKEMGASYFQMDRLSEDQLLHIWRRTAARA
ncbi:MAG: VWA domain-containing protein [Schwartzia sp.]|nr:VWA domain-containing protein [Schwartzia sp. (in: firmicutes)]